MAPAAADVAPWTLTNAPLQVDDVVNARLPVALRGYRFAETDILLDRLTEELRVRDEEIARKNIAIKAAMPLVVLSSSATFFSYEGVVGSTRIKA